MRQEYFNYNQAFQLLHETFPFMYVDEEVDREIARFFREQGKNKVYSLDIYLALYVIQSARKNAKKKQPTQKVLDRQRGRRIRKKRTGSKK